MFKFVNKLKIINMKNIWIASILSIFMFSNISAQDDEGKNFRFGLRGNTSIDWLSPDNAREFSRLGMGLGYGWGMQMEFKINQTNSIVTGLNLTTFSGGLNYADQTLEAHNDNYLLDGFFGPGSIKAIYALTTNFEFIKWDNMDTVPVGDIYLLKERKYKINYVTIPFALKMKTKEIGYFTYFGEFGANLGLKTKARVSDVTDVIAWNAADSTFSVVVENKSLTDLDLAKGTQPIRVGLLVGGGAEYNFSGSTSMFFSLHYHYFVTNTLKREAGEDYLRRFNTSSGTLFENVGAKSIPGSVSLTVGILF